MRVKTANDDERTGARANAHVVVCGNEKGGSGKSTLSMHVIVALLRSGFKVASIDLDSRQKTLTRYIENRQRWTRESGIKLALPQHFAVEKAQGERVSEIEGHEYQRFADNLAEVENSTTSSSSTHPGQTLFCRGWRI